MGDIVFIDIIESNNASVSSGARHSRESGLIGAAVLGLAPIPPAFVAGAAGLNGALSSRKYDGKGSTERSSQIRARIAARVVEVLANGDLRVEAEKQTKINKETEKLILSGYVRVRDISNENSIFSTSVADLKVTLNGKGIASTDNGPGWLIRLIEKYSPF
jgi:flagellar L-ring protein precursor FlgH